MDQDLYREQILDLHNNPHNKGVLSGALQATEHNALCGDSITLYVVVNENDTIVESSFDGTGCAVSQASASLLTDYIKGKTVEDVCALTQNDMERMLGVSLNVVRMRCAVLSLNAAQKAVKK